MSRAPPAAAAVLVAGVLLAGAAIAAVSWTSVGSLHTSVGTPAIQFVQGPGANNTRYFSAFALSANATAFSGTFKGHAGADQTVKTVVSLHNRDTAAHTVTLTATRVTNAQVEAFAWTMRNGTVAVATLDYRAASPSATIALPAGGTFPMDLRLDLADGSGRNNVAVNFDLRVAVT